MKKKISLVLAIVFATQAAFAAPANQMSVKEAAKILVNNGMTNKEAHEYLKAHITPAEFSRISREIKNAEFAGTLDQDLDRIASSIQLKQSTGNYLHGSNFRVLENVLASVTVVAVVGLVIHAGGLSNVVTGGMYDSVGLGL
ncbi:hypothetical protein [Leptospira bandrabouensis]|uniref:Uncharacterized protein n=1 Tax=Leptospira bandrabouensis TaxID=2484903 RepID=A0A6H3P282_9LEPT|nr:hypothetical protein [Leptospira bandrabouensis]MCG6145919.1 hypothetical protein [Leptospira bandrabouensis]MCG6153482.1 hypothetical protein [Leptospira bandrabouensis]MCG6165506.1 hypothetical protein [Leptospira bandrabouensis]MCW7460063.1 hypothetical protein [Leptospira bandrabouensis]MCW7478899.1 hypothetical protein [Leptospira bandrabouensis]